MRDEALSPGLSVIQLDKVNYERYIADLLEIEKLVFEKRGHLYSTQLWGEQQFRMELPGKFDISYGVVKDGKLVAFLICSTPFPELCHVHRVAVHPKHPGDNTGRKLMLRAYREWSRRPEYRMITAITREDHRLTLPFASMLGAKVADRQLMTSLFKQLGRTDDVIGDHHFEDEYGIRYVLLYIHKKAQNR